MPVPTRGDHRLLAAGGAHSTPLVRLHVRCRVFAGFGPWQAIAIPTTARDDSYWPVTERPGLYEWSVQPPAQQDRIVFYIGKAGTVCSRWQRMRAMHALLPAIRYVITPT